MATIKYCKQCGIGYPKRPKQAYWQYEKSLFCSRSCKGKEQGFKIVEQPKKTCVACFKEYQKVSNQPKVWWIQSKYCSQNCYQKRTVSEETKKKMSLSLIGNKNGLGYKHSEEAKRKMSEFQISRWPNKNPKPNPRANRAYKKWRLMILERDNYTCLECGIQGKLARLEVDHIKPFRDFPELRFESSNVRTLCRECHKKTSTYGFKVFTYGGN